MQKSRLVKSSRIQSLAPICILLAFNLFVSAQPPTDLMRLQTLNLLPSAVTNQLITAAAKNCAVLFSGRMQITSERTISNSITLSVKGEPNSILTVGLAVAIDAHGYFLTAAHLVAAAPLCTLVFQDATGLRSAPARVVAQIVNPAKKVHALDLALDLALLHVEDAPLANVFSWAEIGRTPRSGSTVLQLGRAKSEFSESNAFTQLAAFASHLKKITALSTGGAIVMTDSLAREGDSGGPVLNANGKLLGVHSRHGLTLPWFHHLSIASRPDADWLREAIAADQQSPLPPVTNTVVQNVGEPEYITVRLAQ